MKAFWWASYAAFSLAGSIAFALALFGVWEPDAKTVALTALVSFQLSNFALCKLSGNTQR